MKIKVPMLFSFGFGEEDVFNFFANVTPGDVSENPILDWERVYLPKYKEALKCLKMVNPNMNLELIDQNDNNRDGFEV